VPSEGLQVQGQTHHPLADHGVHKGILGMEMIVDETNPHFGPERYLSARDLLEALNLLQQRRGGPVDSFFRFFVYIYSWLNAF